MTRSKVQLKRIENPVRLQISFGKRHASLLKKAIELSVSCDADIGVIIFSTQGKIYQLATSGTMEGLIERYKMVCGEADQVADIQINQPQEAQLEEISRLKQEIGLLQKNIRYIPERIAQHMTLDELLILEKHIEIWLYHIRDAKRQIMFQEIESLKNKEGILKSVNNFLQEKEGILKSANKFLQEKILEQNGIFFAGPITADILHPLSLQNGYYYSNSSGDNGVTGFSTIHN
ncbi:MADS-box transcription factor 26-like [Canna indica]|uniref:MADS-box transcription factor 26-like n=1 Tax=Canna indica TaxID=4628 RepID=A0AAQ3Q1H9_9LILI|nr:MADS-box transcription factor 26-like [Canna indica]